MAKKRIFGLSLRLCCGLLFCFGALLSANGQTATGFRYPDYDANGQLKFEILGEHARIESDGKINITNLKMTFYEQGRVVMQITTPQCLFDRIKREAFSTSEVWVARSGVELTGRGFAWKAETGRMEIHNQARLVFNNPEGRERGTLEGVP